MSKLKIEKIGGYGGYGAGNSRLRSHGEIDMGQLSKEDKNAIEDLFSSKGAVENTLSRDTFRYRISRLTSQGMESIEADEEQIPDRVKQSVKDEII